VCRHHHFPCQVLVMCNVLHYRIIIIFYSFNLILPEDLLKIEPRPSVRACVRAFVLKSNYSREPRYRLRRHQSRHASQKNGIIHSSQVKLTVMKTENKT
jgi:hypothetical protein